MNIGIITLYDSYNYGTYLQAYALAEKIKDLGHNPYFIRFDKKHKRYLKPIKQSLKYKENLLLTIQKILLFNKDWKKIKEVSIDDIGKVGIDGFIIGSDELWNVNNDSFRQYPEYYGIGLPNENILVYAMSIGNAMYEDLEKHKFAYRGIKKLPYITVRDKSTKNVIENITNKKTIEVCDPTFLIEYDRFCNELKNKINKKYILVYSYNFEKKLVEKIIKFSKENNLIIVSACFQYDWCDKIINCTPLQFSSLIKNADYVVTTTFHGTIFSLLNKKKFLTLPFGQKVIDILEKTELTEHIYHENQSYEDFKRIISYESNYDIVDKKIEKYRELSIGILREKIQEFKPI